MTFALRNQVNQVKLLLWSYDHLFYNYFQLEEEEQKSRLPGYSLDDQVVIEAKEKGRELFAHLSLSERKQTLDDKVLVCII